jgi:hypothetical protein
MPPTSTITSSGRASGPTYAERAASMISTVWTESAHTDTSNDGSAASSSAIQRSCSGEITAFAISTRCTPYARATPSWKALASVIAQAPASSCIAQSAGAIVVLPCGASSTPCRVHQVARVSTLCRRPAADRLISGVGSWDSRGLSARISATVRPQKPGGRALSRQLTC